MSNADKIRSMTDGELAEMFAEAEESGSKYGQAGKEWWLLWLTSEVET